MNLLFGYSNCSTCKEARKFLERNSIDFELRDIKEEPPTKEELKAYKMKTDRPLTSFFNTSGVLYREMNLKEKIKIMTEEEIYDCLASDGMLIKRPLLITDYHTLIGFKEDEWKKALSLK